MPLKLSVLKCHTLFHPYSSAQSKPHDQVECSVVYFFLILPGGTENQMAKGADALFFLIEKE